MQSHGGVDCGILLIPKVLDLAGGGCQSPLHTAAGG